MKNFVVIYHAPASAVEQTHNMSPEEMKKGMEAWMAWATKTGDGLVDLGTPLMCGQLVRKSVISPSDSDVMVYSILQAEDMQGATALLEGHPHLEWATGCEIDVHESMPMPT